MSNSIIVVVKAIVLRKGKVLLLKRSSTEKVGAGEWDTAGGKIEFGEELETALIREIMEEAGIDVQVERLLYASTFLTNKSRQVVLLSYLCASDLEEIRLSEEHSDYVWATPEQAASLLPPSIREEWVRHGVWKLEEWKK
ncbi:NUDIX hydrolase [Paenibacillus nanensis]